MPDSKNKVKQPNRIPFELPQIPSRVIPIGISIVAVIVCVILSWLVFFKTDQVSLRVLAYRWIRTIVIEQQNDKFYSGKKSDLPLLAENLVITSSREEQTGTKPVKVGERPIKVPKDFQEPDGTEDKLVSVPQPDKKEDYACNDTVKGVTIKKTCTRYITQSPKSETKKVPKFKTVSKLVDGVEDIIEQQPVYTTFVTANYTVWERIDQVTTSGTDNRPYCPPKPKLFGFKQRSLDCTGTNTVLFSVLGPKDLAEKFNRPLTITISDAEFQNYYKPGQTLTGAVNSIGGLTNLLPAAK